MNTWNAIGVMSGTSVDGLDIVAVEFKKINHVWKYRVIKAISVDYSSELRHRLLDCILASGEELVLLDLELGQFIGKCVVEFMKDLGNRIDLIASHGHTVYHQPEKGMTKQIGDGQSILNFTRTKTINDFRLMDVINGGQGAPLVPIGDRYLFSGYEIYPTKHRIEVDWLLILAQQIYCLTILHGKWKLIMIQMVISVARENLLKIYIMT
jgi:anhydro-N-acetylmuramic acid kinase